MIRLIRYVRIPRDVHRRKITRKAVLARDAYTCQYCGHEASGLTVDHVIPRSRGGQSVWENIVAACAPCNRKKGNRMPREASMVPASRPRPPGPDRVHPDRGAEGPGRLGAVPGRRLTLGRPRKRRAAPIARGGPSKVRLSNRFRIYAAGWDWFRPPEARRCLGLDSARRLALRPSGSTVTRRADEAAD